MKRLVLITAVLAAMLLAAPARAQWALADDTANPPTLKQQSTFGFLFDGSTWDRMRGDSTSGLWVNIKAAVPGTSATSLGKAEDAAHASGDTGLSVLFLRKDDAAQTTGADGDYAAPVVDAYGAIFERSDHPNRIRCATAAVSTATTIQAFGGSCAAPGAALSIYITDISFSTSAAAGTAADSFPTLKYGTGGTCGTGTAVVWGALTGANTTVVASMTTPIKIPANNEVCWIMSTAGSKFIVLTGYIAP
jgi:hypothetical protein